MINEKRIIAVDLPILDKMRHDGCGGRAGKAELLTGLEGRLQPAGAAHRAAGGLTCLRSIIAGATCGKGRL